MLDLRYIYTRLYELCDIYNIDVELGEEIISYSTITVPIYPDIRQADVIPKLAKSKIALWTGLSDKDISLVQGAGCYNLILNTEPQGDLLLSDLLQRLESDHKDIYSNPLSLLVGVDIFNAMITLEISDRNPHLIIAGSSGAGKSNLLSTLLSQVIERDSTDMLSLVIYSPKNEYDQFEGFPSLRYEKIIKEIRDIEAVLEDICAEMSGREKHRGYYNPLLVILDEANSLISLSDKSKSFIESIAMKGRSAHIHLILGFQSSKKSLIQSPIIRENASAKIIMRVADKIESNTLTGVKEINCSKLRIGEAYLISSLGYTRVNIPLDDISESYAISEPSNPPLALIKGGLGGMCHQKNELVHTCGQNETRDISELRDIEKFKALPEEVRNYLKSNDDISVRKLRDGIGVSKDKASAIIKQLDQIEGLLGEAPDGRSPRPINKEVLQEILSVLSSVRSSVLIN